MVKFLPAHASAHVLRRVSRYHAAETHRHWRGKNHVASTQRPTDVDVCIHISDY
jgi:hypothetical protein